jgi:hypothetical protein
MKHACTEYGRVYAYTVIIYVPHDREEDILSLRFRLGVILLYTRGEKYITTICIRIISKCRPSKEQALNGLLQ